MSISTENIKNAVEYAIKNGDVDLLADVVDLAPGRSWTSEYGELVVPGYGRVRWCHGCGGRWEVYSSLDGPARVVAVDADELVDALCDAIDVVANHGSH